MSTNGFSARINYQNSVSAQNVTPQPNIDRARGGLIHIEITIPEETIRVSGGIGRVRIPKKVCSFTIDLEQLPLVDVASYRIEQRQISPERMSYPYGGDKDDGEENKFTGTFERA